MRIMDLREKSCQVCGKAFKPTHPRQVYCKSPCVRVRDRDGKRTKPFLPRICKMCGVSYKQGSSIARLFYCSPECAEKKRNTPDPFGKLRRRAKRYGLTVEQYEELVCRQHGKCAICDVDAGGLQYGVLHIDHDHITQKVRGLLCHDCNRGIGIFKDNVKLLKNAAAYLEKT